jgi:hypothetical protein
MKSGSLESRIQNLEDIEEIKQIQYQYVNSLILNKWDELVECFSENGVFNVHAGSATGKEAIKKIFVEKLAVNHIGKEGLYIVHPIIKVDGDKAKGSWLLYTQFALPRKLKIKLPELPTDDAPDWFQGYYENEYVRENGKWKISNLKYRTRLMSPGIKQG